MLWKLRLVRLYRAFSRECPWRRDSDAVIPPANQSPRQPFKSQNGGKISPAAKRFPLSLFREAVKPPLFVPVLRNRLLSQLCKGKTRGFGPGEYRLDDVRGEPCQLQYPCPKNIGSKKLGWNLKRPLPIQWEGPFHKIVFSKLKSFSIFCGRTSCRVYQPMSPISSLSSLQSGLSTVKRENLCGSVGCDRQITFPWL